MKQSITKAINDQWAAHTPFTVNLLLEGTIAYELPPGSPPFRSQDGTVFRMLTLDYDMEGLKHDHYLD